MHAIRIGNSIIAMGAPAVNCPIRIEPNAQIMRRVSVQYSGTGIGSDSYGPDGDSISAVRRLELAILTLVAAVEV